MFNRLVKQIEPIYRQVKALIKKKKDDKHNLQFYIEKSDGQS